MRVFAVVTFVCFLSFSLAAYPAQTNNLYNAFNSCISKSQSDIDCITSVRDGLQKISDNIQKVRDIKTNMGRINSGFSTFGRVLGIAKYAPGVGSAVNALKTAIDAIKPIFTTAYNKVKVIDSKIYKWKDDVDNGITKCDQANTQLEKLKTACTNGRNSVHTARTCVNSMRNSPVKSNLGNLMETMGGAMAQTANNFNQALGNVGNTCSAIRRLTDLAKAWPNIDPIRSAMSAMYSALKPILDFFALLQSALSKEFCMPDPFEKIRELEIIENTREAAEKTREVAEDGIEAAKKIVNPGSWGGWGRRRRSLDREGKRETIRISRELANSYLAIQKRGSICFSVQKILDGIDSLFKPLLDLAQKAIDKLMSALPRFTLPGLPDFNILDRFNINFNLPSINFGIDINLINFAVRLNFGCALNVKNACAAVSGAVNFNCGSVTGKRELLDVIAERSTIDADYVEDEIFSKRALAESSDIEKRTAGRQDDKHMTVEEARAKMMSLTPEQKRKLREMMENRQD